MADTFNVFNAPAIDSIDDPGEIRVMLLASGRQVHAPLPDTVVAALFRFKTVADLVASRRRGGGIGTIWQAGYYLYEEVATAPSITTDGGVMLLALPDGSTYYAGQFDMPAISASDNVTRLNRAADALTANGGGALEFEPGSYDLASAALGTAGVALPANVLIRGSGAVLNVTGSAACNVFSANNVSDITIEELEVHGNGVTTGFGNGEFIRFTNNTASLAVRNLRIRDLNLYNFAGQYWIAFVANASSARISGISVTNVKATSESGTVVYLPANVGSHAYVIGISSVNGVIEDFDVADITTDTTYIKGTLTVIAAGAINSNIALVQDGTIRRIRAKGAGKNIATNNNASYEINFYGSVRRVELDDFISLEAWDKGLYVASSLDCVFRNIQVSGQTGTYTPLLDAGVSISATRATIDNVRCFKNTVNFIHNASGKYWLDTAPVMDGEYMARRDTTLASWAQSTAYSVGNRVINTGVSTTAWVPSTAYTVGQNVTNGGNTYRAVTNGTSAASGGPTGQNWGYALADGTTSWHYVVPSIYECTVAGTSAASGVGPTSVTLSNITDGTVRWKAVPPNVYRGTVSNADKIGLTGTTGPLSSTTGLTDGDVTWVYVGTEIPIDNKISNLHCEDATVGPSMMLQASGAGKGVEIRNFSVRTSVGKALVAQTTSATYTSANMSNGVIECSSTAAYAVDYFEVTVDSPCGIDWDNITINFGNSTSGARLRGLYGDVNLNNVKINKDLTSPASGSLMELLGSDPTTGGFFVTPSLTNIQFNGVRSGVTGLNAQGNCNPRQMTGINFRTAAGTLAAANSPGLAAPTWTGQTGQRIQNLLVGAGLPAEWVCVSGTTWVGSGYLPLTGSATTDVASIAAGATASFTVTVTGAAVGDEVVSVTPSTALEAGLVMLPGAITAANTATGYIWNTTGGAVDPASRTYTANVRK